MTLREMHDYLTLIYKAGWDDCLEGRKFDPKIPKYLECYYVVPNSPDIASLASEPVYPGKIEPRPF